MTDPSHPRPASPYDGPPLRVWRPECGVALPIAGASCGQLGPGHTREVLRAASERQLGRLLADWRCACGRHAYGEDRR
ncbi:hypothetical protein KF840_23055 [bacterium]|nr:hypothetical protein [bacterium]MBX3027784.1 hypothetical protein [bacterium]